MRDNTLFSVITPSRGNRPNALAQAIHSVAVAAQTAHEALAGRGFEMLVGFDGVHGKRVGPEGGPPPQWVRFFDLPYEGNFGNALRHAMLKAAKGSHVLFLDDDNALTPEAFNIYIQGLDHEMQIARIDVSRAFDKPFLPEDLPGREIVRPGNIDPLCLCLLRELVVDRCDGWRSEGGYESDYLNILRYSRRALSVRVTPQLAGIYDAGAWLDEDGANPRQRHTSPGS